MDVDGRKMHVVLAPSISLPQFPKKPGVIRFSHITAITRVAKFCHWAAKNDVLNFLKVKGIQLVSQFLGVSYSQDFRHLGRHQGSLV
ncbi:Phosphatidylcholine transfer protein [Fukomys damarensis]|uniref:Phosphatidylcholine transfer protein n=1 Tax=Fukomys damarensis TaxID=885580 RepID=A0A091DL20_FUKDA|nr:Phosphatidylcholine transfer protein [Fukomys damarensis]